MTDYRLHSIKGWGGMLAELALELTQLPFHVKYYSPEELAADTTLGKLNPRRQVPTLELPDGSVLTESLAICTYLAELAKLADLPGAGAPERARYLRWSTFLVGQIYATFTYADYPERFVDAADGQAQMKARVRGLREAMWRQVEEAAAPRGPWFLGERRSLIDLFVAVMTAWTPRDAWFAEHAPRLSAIARAYRALPEYKKVAARNEG